MSVANKITLVRIVSLPLLIVFLYGERHLYIFLALVTFVVLALTDLLDGWVARTLGQVTRTGKLLDPVADKMLVLAALLPLIERGLIAAWLGVLIMGRELLVNGLRMIAAGEGTVVSAGTLGKYKTLVYIVAISFVIGARLFPPPFERPLHLVGIAGLWLGFVLAVTSAAGYFRRYGAPEPRPGSLP